MITRNDFNQLVERSTQYITVLQDRINELESQLADFEKRLAHIENRKKPGPKPRAEAA
jgi:predicted  nucleic acid-binding Zn-ribbon protein